MLTDGEDLEEQEAGEEDEDEEREKSFLKSCCGHGADEAMPGRDSFSQSLKTPLHDLITTLEGNVLPAIDVELVADPRGTCGALHTTPHCPICYRAM